MEALLLSPFEVLEPTASLVSSFAASLSASLTATFALFFEAREDGAGLIFLLLLGGPAFFTITYLRYRNTDKRHKHEAETPAEMCNLKKYDNLVQHLTRQKSRTIEGANNNSVKGSLGSDLGSQGQDTLKTLMQGAVPGGDSIADYVNKQLNK